MLTRDLRALCEEVLLEHDAAQLGVVIEPRRREDALGDLRLVFADRAWLRSAAGQKLANALNAHPVVAEVQQRKSAIQVRFTDQVLIDLEQELAAGEPLIGEAKGRDSGLERVIVSFIGPNTNKALHVGHLRNAYVGEALASALETAGVEVHRLNLVGDIGRRMAEAMAGYLGAYQGREPADLELQTDRFVELCCRSFGKKSRGERTAAEDPNAEERKAVGDLADELLARWLAGAPPETDLWRRMRDWSIEGHERTLERLGIRFDEYGYESDAVPHAMALIEEGVERGIFEREEEGGVVYRTGQSEYPTMVMLRDDGFPTEHARLLAAYDRILAELSENAAYLELAGLEWQPAIAVICKILEDLQPGPRNEANLRVFHGSLTEAEGQKIGSSVGEPTWVDDFVDEVEQGPAVAALEQLADGRVGRAELADLLIRGTFLCAPLNRPLMFTPEAVSSGRSGPGWTIAEAWCKARAAQGQDEGAPLSSRAVVMQSQQFGLSLERTVSRHDVTSLSRYLLNLSELCTGLPSPGPAAAGTMAQALRALGFLAGRGAQGAGTESRREEAGVL
ncbi:MAG TPA: arginine--tRNA ligase [Solirubrobacterales bacterium]|nr:arginine--tRNA ligase [Solirubrobacterales bacterium]